MRRILFLVVGIAMFGFSHQNLHAQYCIAGPTSPADSEVDSVHLQGATSTIAYSKTCPGVTGLNNQTANHSADLLIGNTYNLSVYGGTCNTNNFHYTNMGTVYIDFNGNGTFEPSEVVGTRAATVTPFVDTYSFMVPTSAVVGTTRMRVIQWETSTQTLPINPCPTGMTWGSIIDFEIDIVSPGPCTNASVGAASASSTQICSGNSVNLNASSVSFGTGTVYQWQSSPNNTTWTNMAGANSVFQNSGVLTSTTYFRLKVTCGNDSAFSSSVMVNVIGAALAGGTYTINSVQATSGTNFQSFADFSAAVLCGGIAGPVVLNVVPNSGPYNEQIDWGNITGTSSISTITVNGNGNTVAFNSSDANKRATLMMNGTKHVLFRDLIFDASGTGTYGWAAQLLGANTEFITFKNCVFKSLTSSTSINFSGLTIGGTATSATGTGAGPSNITVDSCTVEGGYYGVVVVGATSGLLSQNNKVTNTEIADFYFYGMFLRSQEDGLFERNVIHRQNRVTVSTFYGVYLNGSSPGIKVSKNIIHTSFGPNSTPTTTTTAYPIYLTAAVGTVAKPMLFTNNKLYNVWAPGTFYGLYILGTCDHLKIYHNTFNFGNPSNTNSGTARAFFATGTSTGLEFKNNILTLDEANSGAQHLVYFSTTGSTVDFSNNAYNLQNQNRSNANFGYWGSNQPTFADWQSVAGQTFDVGSNYGDPIFIDPANGDLTPATAVADGIGANLLSMVPDDFFGIARTSTPDAGAIEYTPLPCLPPFNISGSVGASNIAIAWQAGTDADSVRIEWGPQGFQPGTGDSLYTTDTTYNITQYNNLPIGPNECYDVYMWAHCNGVLGLIRVGPITYCTECSNAQMPYSELFTKWEPDCFVFDAAGTMEWEHNAANDLAQVRFWSFNNQTAAMQTRAVDISTGAWVRFKWAHLYNSTYPNDRLVVRVKEINTTVWDTIFDITGQAFDSPNALTTSPPANKSDFVETTAILDSSYINKTVVVEFVGISGWGPHLYIDEVHVEAVPPCLPPTSVSTSSPTSTSFNVNWTTVAGTCFDVEWGVPGFIPGSGLGLGMGNNVTSPYNITGLTPGNTYQVYARDCCDTLTWIGPATITLPKDFDAEMLSVISPDAQGCGDSAMVVEIQFRNDGLNTITSMPATAVVSGAVNTTLTATYTGNLASGDTATLVLGSINTYGGGTVSVQAYTQLANDQWTSNDTFAMSGAYVPFEPEVPASPIDLCDADSVTLWAVSYSLATVHGWYTTPTGGTPFATGDSVKVSATGPNTYYVAYESQNITAQVGAGTQTSTSTTITPYKTFYMDGRAQYMWRVSELNAQGIFAGNINSIAFDVVSAAAAAMNGFTIKIGTTTLNELTGFVPNTGFSTVFSQNYTATMGWNVHTFTTPFVWNGNDNLIVEVCFDNNAWTSNSSVRTDPTTYSSVYDGYADLATGSGCVDALSIQGPRTERPSVQFNVASDGCSDIRKAITFNVKPSPQANFSASVQPAPSLMVNFDASGSTGADVYIWNFGDGNMQTTNTPTVSHTYTSGGDYSVTLIVQDTTCQSADTLTQMVASVYVEELARYGFQMYPNPTHERVWLILERTGTKTSHLTITDAAGRVVYYTKIEPNEEGFRQELDVRNFAKGLYHVRITFDDNVLNQKLMVH